MLLKNIYDQLCFAAGHSIQTAALCSLIFFKVPFSLYCCRTGAASPAGRKLLMQKDKLLPLDVKQVKKESLPAVVCPVTVDTVQLQILCLRTQISGLTTVFCSLAFCYKKIKKMFSSSPSLGQKVFHNQFTQDKSEKVHSQRKHFKLNSVSNLYWLIKILI